MKHHLPDLVVREVLAHENDLWLRRWAGRGWTPVAEPIAVGTTSTGRTVLRHVLAHAPDAEHTPGFAFVPPFADASGATG